MKKTIKPTPSNKELSSFLSTMSGDTGFIDSLKIQYRPFVCPFDELIEYADDVKSVYDIGCGSGQFCALIAEYTGVEKIKGIEVDDTLVANAKRINASYSKKDVKFSKFSGKNIPSDIADYDLLYMIDVYHHIPLSVRDKMLKQIYDKMKPGAKLMFKDINGSSPFVLLNKMHDLVFAKEIGHETGFKKSVQLLESLGFTILETRKRRVFVYPHYFILAQK